MNEDAFIYLNLTDLCIQEIWIDVLLHKRTSFCITDFTPKYGLWMCHRLPRTMCLLRIWSAMFCKECMVNICENKAEAKLTEDDVVEHTDEKVDILFVNIDDQLWWTNIIEMYENDFNEK